MPTFIMLTRLATGALRSPRSLESLEKEAMERIRSECSAVEWVGNYALLGPWDYLDIFRAPDIETCGNSPAAKSSEGVDSETGWSNVATRCKSAKWRKEGQ